MPYIESQDAGMGRSLLHPPLAIEADPLPAIGGTVTLQEFYRRGKPMVDACLAAGQGCAMAIVDIDHLRRVNDGHGMPCGDRVLQSVAKRIGTLTCGQQSLVSRLGGDEFGLLLADLDCQGARDLCARIASDIATMEFHGAVLPFAVTVSIGLATIREPETFDNYLNAADQFLFMAKANGRNRVFSEQTLLSACS